jgi:3-hydroxyacyl-CoA dehydrogenase
MGHAIAQDFAMAGHQVLLNDIDAEALVRATEGIRQNLEVMVGFGLARKDDVPGVVNRITTSVDLADSTRQPDLVVEAVSEDLDLKQKVFSEIAKHAPAAAVLASNTSSFPPDVIARAVDDPRRLLVTHFFNPPYLVPLVEVVRGESTSDDTVQRVVGMLKGAGKVPVVIAKAVPGFLINRLQIALLREALYLVQTGVVTVEDLDLAVRNSIGRRLSAAGVFEVCDVSGLDIVEAVAANVIGDLDCSNELSGLVEDRVKKGHLGIKTGRGFYEWTAASVAETRGRIATALAAIKRWHLEPSESK